MTLRPCPQFVLVHGGNAVNLRASLRAALELATLETDGFARLVEKIANGNLAIIHAVIRAGATDRAAAGTYLTSIADKPLASFLQAARAACLGLVDAVLATPGNDPDPAPSTARKPATAKPWREHFADLYGFGTGWLGWPPEAVWNASPAELTAAFEAHAERLIAINGGAGDDDTAGPNEEQRQANIAEGLDPEFDRQALQALKTKLAR